MGGSAAESAAAGGKNAGDERAHLRVPLPQPRPFLDTFRANLKETFFPDDPFRSFKGQPQRAKFLLAVKYLFPVLEWAPGYSLSLFKSDLIAGLTIASLAIPQACAHYSPTQ
jgi:sulfate transporter 3